MNERATNKNVTSAQSLALTSVQSTDQSALCSKPTDNIVIGDAEQSSGPIICYSRPIGLIVHSKKIQLEEFYEVAYILVA